MKIVKSLWEEILEILEENIPSFSSDILENGVRLERIKEVEKIMNIEFPKELKALYMSNNGTIGLGAILGFELISLEDILTEWKINKNALNNGKFDNIEFKSSKEETVRNVGFDEKWIPFAYDNLHTYLAIDLNPDENGKVGQIINIGDAKINSIRYVLADSMEELLQDTVMIYECNGLEVEEEIEVLEDKEEDVRELLAFLDKHFFNIKATYKGLENEYDDIDFSYNSRDYDDYQEEDGYDDFYEDDEYSRDYGDYEDYKNDDY